MSTHYMTNPVNRKEIDDVFHNVNTFALPVHKVEGLRVDEATSFLGEICCSFRGGFDEYGSM